MSKKRNFLKESAKKMRNKDMKKKRLFKLLWFPFRNCTVKDNIDMIQSISILTKKLLLLRHRKSIKSIKLLLKFISFFSEIQRLVAPHLVALLSLH